MDKVAICLSSLHHQDLKSLLEHREQPALSLYLPAAGASRARELFQQGLQEAEAQLDEYGLSTGEQSQLLEPVRELLQAPGIWRQSADGLAVFSSGQYFHYYFSAAMPEIRVVVDDYFYVIPLITDYLLQKPFYILDLNRLSPRLYLATQQDICEATLDGLAAPVQVGLERLARQVRRFLQGRLGPLLVVCQDSQRFKILRDLLTLEGLELECYQCEADACTLKDLHQQAWQQLVPLLRLDYDNALRSYRALEHSAQILQDVAAVAQAAYNSRVEKLFLVASKQPGGKGAYFQRRRIEELLNRAAIYTYLNGGEVYTVLPEQLSGIQDAAAILRY